MEFIQMELDLVVTFCNVSLTTNDDFGRAERNADNARIAPRTALLAKDQLSVTEQESQAISIKTSAVVFLLVQLEHHCVRFPGS